MRFPTYYHRLLSAHSYKFMHAIYVSFSDEYSVHDSCIRLSEIFFLNSYVEFGWTNTLNFLLSTSFMFKYISNCFIVISFFLLSNITYSQKKHKRKQFVRKHLALICTSPLHGIQNTEQNTHNCINLTIQIQIWKTKFTLA